MIHNKWTSQKDKTTFMQIVYNLPQMESIEVGFNPKTPTIETIPPHVNS